MERALLVWMSLTLLLYIVITAKGAALEGEKRF